jgi:hypothetical protein
MVPLSPAVRATLGRDSGRGVAVAVLGLASLMLAVGWESLPRIRPTPQALLAAVAVCVACVSVVTVHAAWSWPRSPWASTSVGAQLIDWSVVALLLSFAASNLRTIRGLWRTLPAVGSGAAGTAAAVGGVLVIATVLLETAWSRAWVLVLPGAATCLLYVGFAVGLWSRRDVHTTMAVNA